MKQKILKKEYLPQGIFFGGMAAGTFWLIGSALSSNGQAIINLLHQNPDDAFMDFFNNLSFSFAAYDLGASYPPLACILNGIFAQLIPMELRNQYSLGNRYVIRDSQIGIMTYLVVLLLIILAFSFFFRESIRGCALKKGMALCSVLFSAPFLFAYERANLILIALVFAMAFIWGYKSENRWIRWFSFICLSLAAAIKIYPAVLGLLLVRERRWKDTAVLAGCGIAAFMLPFLVFEGGFSNLFKMLENLTTATNVMSSTHYGLKHDLTNFLGILTEATGRWFVGYARLAIILLLVSTVVVVVFRCQMASWKAAALLCSLMILVPGFSYTYTLIFMALPLALFLGDREGESSPIMDCIYAVLFLGIFMPLVFPEVTVDMLGISEPYRLTPVTLMENIALIGMVGCILVQEVVNCIHEKISRNPQ